VIVLIFPCNPHPDGYIPPSAVPENNGLRKNRTGIMEYRNDGILGFSVFHPIEKSENDYESLDQLHYRVENALLKLIESLQKKQADRQWEDNFHSK